MNLNDYIEINPQKRFGKPVLKGTRIAVGDVLNWLANGMSNNEIMHDFPEVSNEHIRACLLYASQKESNLGFAS